MCEPATAIAVGGLVLGAATAVMSANAQEEALDRQYSAAQAKKRAADAASAQQLTATKDKASREAGLAREKSLREQLEAKKNSIQDTGEALTQAAATGTSGFTVDNLVSDLYRQEAQAVDVTQRNTMTQLTNISSGVADAQYSHNVQLASGGASRGAGVSDLALGLDIGTAAIGAAGTYKQLGGTFGSDTTK